MEMEYNWMKAYKNVGLITWNNLSNHDYYRDFAEDSAKFHNWNYLELEGDESLLKNLLNAKFNENEVILVPPNRFVEPSYDDQIIKLAEADTVR